LTDAAPGTGLEGSIYAGLESLCEDLLSREWRQDNSLALRIERLLIDANWGSSTDVVHQFCRQSNHAAIVMPSHGRYVGAASLPFAEYRRKPGGRIGQHWRIPAATGRRAIRYALYDTNFWKSFLQARLAVRMSDRGCLSLFDHEAGLHRGFAGHLTAEYRVRTSGRGREVGEWKLRPQASDHHWLDCFVGACLGASMQGIELRGHLSRGMRRDDG
jgi:phage terminase large subunit GpA-like protein